MSTHPDLTWRGLTRGQQELIALLKKHPFALNKELAAMRGVSVQAVKHQMANILSRLGIRSRHVLVDWIRHGLS